MSCNINPTAKQEVEKHIAGEKTFFDVTAVENQFPIYTGKHTAALNHRDNHLATT